MAGQPMEACRLVPAGPGGGGPRGGFSASTPTPSRAASTSTRLPEIGDCPPIRVAAGVWIPEGDPFKMG